MLIEDASLRVGRLMSPGYRASVSSATKIAARQYGAISRGQALGVGVSEDAIDRLVSDEIWVRLFPASYSLWTPTGKDERWRQRIWGASLWLGDGAVVSHRTAAKLWQLERIESSLLEFSTTGRRGLNRDDLVVRRVSRMTRPDITYLNRLRITSVRRTMLDLASLVPDETLELAGEFAIRRKLVTVKQLMKLLEETGRSQAGRAALRRFLKHFPGVATESGLEVLVWRLIRESGLPLPQRQHVINDASRAPIGRVDFAYLDERLVIEADGYGSHSRKSEFLRDRVRQNTIIRLGWIVYRVTWDDVVHRSKQVVADIADLLANRRAEV